jgi:hypothetical protein
MANFVAFAEARRALVVLNMHYRENDFRKAAITEANGSAVWARRSNADNGGDLTIEVDLDALPAAVSA